jgi:hypothetical protein
MPWRSRRRGPGLAGDPILVASADLTLGGRGIKDAPGLWGVPNYSGVMRSAHG